MIRLHLVCAAVLSVLTCLPAAAADLPLRHPWFAPAKAYWGREPFYLVNQGPVVSGPDIAITDIGYTNTDVHRSYAFIGSEIWLRPRRRW
jgi:hypothetical protein